ncbi:hypothetical protein RBTH_03633 [Bacillus thuringiensis serovar israelensis ATCC 35646]|nr:hypothetical protein RBTH_03633 [Bacillus thuringiensis serovar israelensis ATCC 35646]
MYIKKGNDKMNRLVGLKQFEITRGALLQFMETLDDKTADTQPEGFNNTIPVAYSGPCVNGKPEVFIGLGKNSKHYQLNYPSNGLGSWDYDHSKWENKGTIGKSINGSNKKEQPNGLTKNSTRSLYTITWQKQSKECKPEGGLYGMNA